MTPEGESGRRRTVARRIQNRWTCTPRLSAGDEKVQLHSVKSREHRKGCSTLTRGSPVFDMNLSKDSAFKAKKMTQRESRILTLYFPGTGITKWELLDHGPNGQISLAFSLGTCDSRMVLLLLRQLKATLYRLSIAIQILSFLLILSANVTKKAMMIQLSGGSSVMALDANLDESKILAEAVSILKGQTDLERLIWWNSPCLPLETDMTASVLQLKRQMINLRADR